MRTRPQPAAFLVLALTALVLLAVCLPAAALALEPAPLTLLAAPQTLVYGQKTTLEMQMSAPDLDVTLSRQAADGSTVLIAKGPTGPDGAWSFSQRPTATTVYRVDFAGNATWAASFATVTVTVSPRLVLKATIRKPLLETKRVKYTVTEYPEHPGGTVELQSYAGTWSTLKTLTLNARSTATIRLPAGAPGKLAVRASAAADAEHAAATSPVWRTTVYDKSNPWGVPTRYPHLILVSVHHYKLYYYERGVLIRTFDCVTGRPGLPTPLGHFRIYAKDPHIGGPYGPYRMRYLGLFAIHGTNEPWLLSKYPRNFSHGCTRLSNAHISWLYPRVHVGTPVWNVP